MTKQQLRPFWLGLSAGAMVATVAVALFFANSETVLRSSFTTALTRAALHTKEIASAAPISGSEEFWLAAMRRDRNAPVTKTISLGDKISLTLGGERRTLEVATVADFAPQTTEIDTSAGPTHFVLVTARDVNDATARPVRFVMELEQGLAPLVAGRGGRTL
jgi:hypothetical protein